VRTSSSTDRFIEEILADRPAEGFRPEPGDAEVLNVAITLRAARSGSDEPDELFVEKLRSRLVAAADADDGYGIDTTDARPTPRPHLESQTVTPIGPGRRRRRTVRLSAARVASAAAAVLLVGGTVVTATVERHPQVAVVHSAVTAGVVRSGELLNAQGRPLGRMYAYQAGSSWVFMQVHVPDVTGVYTCELQMVDGTTVRAGTVVLQHGSGAFAHIVKADVSRLRGAKLVTPNGSTLASATFS